MKKIILFIMFVMLLLICMFNANAIIQTSFTQGSSSNCNDYNLAFGNGCTGFDVTIPDGTQNYGLINYSSTDGYILASNQTELTIQAFNIGSDTSYRIMTGKNSTGVAGIGTCTDITVTRTGGSPSEIPLIFFGMDIDNVYDNNADEFYLGFYNNQDSGIYFKVGLGSYNTDLSLGSGQTANFTICINDSSTVTIYKNDGASGIYIDTHSSLVDAKNLTLSSYNYISHADTSNTKLTYTYVRTYSLLGSPLVIPTVNSVSINKTSVEYNENVGISAECQDEVELTSIWYANNLTGTMMNVSNITAPTNPYNYSVTVINNASANQVVGNIFTCVNSIGTSAQSEMILFNSVDITSPIVSFISPTPANNSLINYINLVFNISINEPNLYNIVFNFNGTTETNTFSNDGNGYWHLDKLISSEGDYTYSIFVNDTSGNSFQSGTYQFIVDNVPPTIVYIFPNSDNTTISKTEGRLNIFGFNIHLINGTLNVYNNTDEITYQNFTLFSNPSEYFTDTLSQIFTGKSDGIYRLNTCFGDEAGNENCKEANITIDNIAPTINKIECQVSGNWIECTSTNFNDVVTQTRINCTDNLGNTQANITFYNGTSIVFEAQAVKSGNLFTVNNDDFALSTIGTWRVDAYCNDVASVTSRLDSWILVCSPNWQCTSRNSAIICANDNTKNKCNFVTDSNSCGISYSGNYAEFGLTNCLGIQSTLSETGKGLGIFLEVIRSPLVKFLAVIMIIGAIIVLIVGLFKGFGNLFQRLR